MRDQEAIGKIRAHIRTVIAVTKDRTESLIRNNTIPSRPIDPIKVYEPAEYRRWWGVILVRDKVDKVNLTVTFSDGEVWDLRGGAEQYVRKYL